MGYNNFSNFNNSNNEEEGKMAWDLRQVFAKDIVGETLKLIALARRVNDYPNWFKLLKRDLATEIYKNLSPEENQDIDEKIKSTIEILNKNISAYQKKVSDAKSINAVENALIDLEKLMLNLMQVEGMFGSKEAEDEGL